MISSMMCRICLATLVAWWSLMLSTSLWSAAPAQEVGKPVAANTKTESQAGEVDEDTEAGGGVGWLKGEAQDAR